MALISDFWPLWEPLNRLCIPGDCSTTTLVQSGAPNGRLVESFRGGTDREDWGEPVSLMSAKLRNKRHSIKFQVAYLSTVSH